MRNKEQSTEHSTEQSTVQSTVQSAVKSTVQSTVQSMEQPSVQSSGAYSYGVGILAVLAIGVCVLFMYNKKAGQVIHEEPITPKDVICFRKIYNK